ncbi:hypothetical protein UFOVP238_33 [uncultured Caudovirales phage]|uniref:Uncharacterized protein n=1 Tax=uncultured Caudovirales phage TaxID=2100421 RepID=A0A6J7WU52_9CAUD|nr:hypothetical protein UFOVP238_33 [uncultured Caudovirales phage]
MKRSKVRKGTPPTWRKPDSWNNYEDDSHERWCSCGECFAFAEIVLNLKSTGL